MSQTKNLSSLEKLLLGIDQPQTGQPISHHRKGDMCPQCNQKVLDYNCLLQLECSACGFKEGSEGVGCT